MKSQSLIRMRFDAIGYKNVQSHFNDMPVNMQSARQQFARSEGRQLVEALKAEAPKASGAFAKGLRRSPTKGVDKAGSTEVTIIATGKHAFLLPFIIRGTHAHEIPTGGAAAQIAKGYPLRFYWEKGPRGPGIYHFWRVWHPGTKANNFIHRAVKRRQNPMRQGAKRTMTRVVRTKQYGMFGE